MDRFIIKSTRENKYEVEFILWPLYIDYEKEVLKSSVKEEYKNQLSKLQCKVLMINSYFNDLNEARGGFYIFESDTIIEESPLGKEGILITDF